MVGTGLKVSARCESRMHHNQREPIQVLALLPLSTSYRPKKRPMLPAAWKVSSDLSWDANPQQNKV